MKRFPVSFRLLGGFQPVMGGLGSAVNADLVHEFLVGGDSGFQFFQLFPSGVLPGNSGFKGCVHIFGAGKTMLGKKIHGLCHLFEIKGFRPTLVADAFSLGSFGGYIHKPLRAVGVRGDLGGFCPLYALRKLRLVFLPVLRLCGCSVGVLLENSKDSGLVKVRPQLPGGDGLCSVRREIGQPPPALLNGNPIVLHESSGEILKGF